MMPIFFSQGGPVLSDNPVITRICLKAVFQTTIPLKAIWAQCND